MDPQVAVGEWENEGGAPASAITGVTLALTGTANQIDWAEQIKERVSQDFDRVANAMKSVAARQVDRVRSDIDALIVILEDKRSEVMSKDQAGYFIRDWQDPGDQVRQMIINDPRYGVIKVSQAERKAAPNREYD